MGWRGSAAGAAGRSRRARRIATASAAAGTVPLSTVPLSTVPLSTVPLSTVPLSTVPLSTVPLSTVPLSTVPLSTALLYMVPLLAACGSAAPAPATSGTPTGTITVLAAASLTETFADLGHRFETTYPGTRIRFSFAASSTLASQVAAGAPADVFAAASVATMEVAQQAGGLAGKPVEMATNELEIAVPPGNPGHVDSLNDFADANLRLAVCDPSVPCGATARTLFGIAGVNAHPDTYEPDVKAVLTKVRLDEVDAGLVYHTDVRSAGDAVVGIDVPQASQARTSYPVAVVRQSRNATAAGAFVAFVSGPTGRAVLADAGFGPP